MTLPATITNAALWSDHKNQSHGGAQRVTSYTDQLDNGTFYNLGDTSQYVGLISGFTGQAGHKLVRVRLFLQRVGSPSGNLSVELRPTTVALNAPDFTTLWAVSKFIPVSSVPTSGRTEVVFTFPAPATLPSPDSVAFTIVLTASVQGDTSNYIKVYRGANGSGGGSQSYGGSWTATGSGVSLQRVIEISRSGARVIALEKTTNNELRYYKTDDNGGGVWSQEAAVGINTTVNLKTGNSQAGFNDVGITYSLRCSATLGSLWQNKRGEGVGGEDPSTGASFATFGTNVTGTAPIFGGRRANGNTIIIAQGATETVMGAERRRIKLAFHNGTSWSAIFDVQGSANTPNSTLPADAVHYELRWAGVDPNGDCHIVYSRSDSSALQYRKFKSDNTFATVNTLNGAVASATANYPVGQPCFSYDGTSWRIHVPYVDNGTNTLKQARCVTTSAETSANWTLTQIVAANAETSTSNPAVLIADNSQGGKVYCWRVKPTTKGLAMTHDSGSNTWVTETDWRGATQQVGGISGFYVEDGIALVYLEESTTPDELRYDRL